MQKIIAQIAAELKVAESQVKAAVELLDGGATVPFVARYRKEATGGLDDTQLRTLDERLGYLRGEFTALAADDLCEARAFLTCVEAMYNGLLIRMSACA